MSVLSAPRARQLSRSFRRDLIIDTLLASAAIGSPLPVWATSNALQQESILQEHANRFGHEVPAAVSSIILGGRKMRSLIATVDVPTNNLVAAYPVEVVSDDDDHDDTYAIGIFREVMRNGGPATRVEFDGVSGVPTRTSLQDAFVDGLPTIAMFANEPDARHQPNCELVFPTTTLARIHLGEVYSAYLRTTRAVRRGEMLTWCYGESYVDRGYPTSCPGDI